MLLAARDLGAVGPGLEGFVLLAVDELELAVQTSTAWSGVPAAGAIAAAHGRRPVRVRDLPVIWICGAAATTGAWSETSPQIPARASLTTRAAQVACRRAATVSRRRRWDLGVGWMRAVVEHGAPRVDDPARLAGVRALGVDETAFLAANATHPTEFATGLVVTRTAGPARLLDIVQVAAQCSPRGHGRDESWRAGVRVAALDPFRVTPPHCAPTSRARSASWTPSTKLGFDAVAPPPGAGHHRGRAGTRHSARAAPRPRPPQRHLLDPAVARARPRRPRRSRAAAWSPRCSTATPIPTAPRRRSPAGRSARTASCTACAPWTWREELLARFHVGPAGPTEAVNPDQEDQAGRARIGTSPTTGCDFCWRTTWDAPGTTMLRGR